MDAEKAQGRDKEGEEGWVVVLAPGTVAGVGVARTEALRLMDLGHEPFGVVEARALVRDSQFAGGVEDGEVTSAGEGGRALRVVRGRDYFVVMTNELDVFEDEEPAENEGQ